MKNLRARMSAPSGNEAGLSLVEIMVAMMIFAVIAMAVAASLLTSLSITRDNKSRHIASNLAAAEIDRVRAVGNPFDVHSGSKSVTVGAEGAYSITTTAGWVTPTGNVDTCGTAGGPLQYKSVTVTVKWAGMRDEDSAVRSDTLLAPSSRINDPTKGTILVAVKDAMGLGKAGVSFTVTPSTGLGVLTPTDADGCSFILEAPPGDYTVKLTGTDMIDSGMIDPLRGQRTDPSKTLTVTEGSSASFSFEYDKRMRYNVNYASNVTGTRPLVPTNLDYTFINSYGVFPTKAAGSGTSWYADRFPWSMGYQAVAGKYIGVAPSCTSVDPESWDPDTRVSPALAGVRQTAIPGAAGGVDVINVPMGVVTVSGGGTQRWLTAVSQADILLPGQPSCANDPSTIMSYDFGQIFPSTGSLTTRVALPFGSWKLFTRSAATGALVPYAGTITLVTAGQPADPAGLFALDPR